MQETYQYDPRSQTIAAVPGNKWSPVETYSAWDGKEFVGDFLTRGAANFVLGCLRQIRESAERRIGRV